MKIDEVQYEYEKRKPLYQRALDNVQQSLKIFLEENNIQYLSVLGRIKTLDSFVEKIERKDYGDPFNDNEDFCGLRIIVYYPDDIDKVQKIIKDEFDSQEQTNKAESLEINEFGYRSKHSIVKIKKEWLVAPNYRGLDNIKLEIQVRTILMHAWAEIEHKLVYKKRSQVPKQLHRVLFRLSAKFEEADEQFQELRVGIEEYRTKIKEEVKVNGQFSEKLALDYDILVTMLSYYLPTYPKNQHQAIEILNKLNKKKYKVSDVEDLLKKIQPIAAEINTDIFPEKKLKVSQATLLRYSIDIFKGVDEEDNYSPAKIRRIKKFVEKYTK